MGYTLAEEAGLLLGLTTTLPSERSATGRLTPQPLTKLLHLVGRERALEEEIAQVVLDAKGTPGVTWKDIGDVWGSRRRRPAHGMAASVQSQAGGSRASKPGS